MDHAPKDDAPTNSQRRGLLRRLAAASALLGTGVVSANTGAKPHHVVYHISDTARAIPAIRNITNHLKARPDTRIVVVALGRGIDFLLSGNADEHGNSYDALVDTLMFKGVEFRVCNNTLEARQIGRDRVLPDVRIVESGVAELARLQIEEACAYIKP